MEAVDLNYFVCTLEQAERLQHDGARQPFSSVVGLIDEQATRFANDPALGFANVGPKTPGHKPPNLVTFRELGDLSISAARILYPRLKFSNRTIGLLCASSLEFVLTWSALIRLGHPVLLLSPQLGTQAITHLCDSLNVNLILVDAIQEVKCAKVPDSIAILKLPSYYERAASLATQDEASKGVCDPPFFFHTSGTSSGLPKPIAQKNSIVGALPRLENKAQIATFTTTPLYHGGLVDCLRAWASGAMIWLFPEGMHPITGTNLLKAVAFARAQSHVPVGYFSSVPYVLQMLAEDDQGLQLLQTMKLVGVGGAALPVATGDDLVRSGVRLLSRFGSAECGFLLSSHREYSSDKEWRSLRPSCDSRHLSFEHRGDGLSELVVKHSWPSMAKSNREDGSYATSDLFEPHPHRPNEWLYHSRADAQLTLANGEKFDPSPLEAIILSSTKLLSDIYVFGTGRPCAGAILFHAGKRSQEDVIDTVWPLIDKVNSLSPSYARISRPMLVVVLVRIGDSPLEKSSKGTILRRQADERYKVTIASTYAATYSQEQPVRQISDDQLLSAVLDCFARVLCRPIDPGTDIYRQGVDSIACVHIRKLLESTCLAKAGQHLPLNIIYDQGTVLALVSYLRDVNGSKDGKVAEEDTNTHLEVMHKLADKYRVSFCIGTRERESDARVLVLTGATGFLGQHLLRFLRQSTQVDKVYCLVRASSPLEAHQRVCTSLSERGWPTLDQAGDLCDVVCLPCNTESEGLGLSGQHRQQLQQEASIFIHAAWSVNFNLRLETFEGQLAGTRDLVELAMESCARFVFVSSTAAVSSSTTASISETVSRDASDASPLGYSRSKWVAERICSDANDQMTSSGAPHSPVSIVRVGQLCGDETGAWNTSEAYPLMLSTAGIIGCLPNLPHEVLDWIPVHLAAQALLDISLPFNGSAVAVNNNSVSTQASTPVYHVLNPHQSTSWQDMLQWASEASIGNPFIIVSPAAWVKRLDEMPGHHPSLRLLGLWMHAFSEEELGQVNARKPVFNVTQAREASEAMRRVKPLDGENVLRMWHWIGENITP